MVFGIGLVEDAYCRHVFFIFKNVGITEVKTLVAAANKSL
jgi:hypothetical protein